ncbi:MAG: hypothetical protein AAF658_21525, partial [Myxococcota bacterium]
MGLSYTGSNVAVLVLLSFAACTADVSLPESSTVACESDLDCLDGFSCREASCVSNDANSVPVISLGTIERTLGEVTIPVVVFDVEGDAIDIEAEFRVGDSSYVPIVLADSTQLDSSADGVFGELRWSNARADLEASGQSGYVTGVQIKLRPRDSEGVGAVLESARFAYGNSAPTITNLQLSETITGNAIITFSVIDEANDPVEITSLELSVDPSSSEFTPLTLDDAHFPVGRLTAIESSTGGIQHTLVWDSILDVPGD